jgi:hypothetical protein
MANKEPTKSQQRSNKDPTKKMKKKTTIGKYMYKTSLSNDFKNLRKLIMSEYNNNDDKSQVNVKLSEIMDMWGIYSECGYDPSREERRLLAEDKTLLILKDFCLVEQLKYLYMVQHDKTRNIPEVFISFYSDYDSDQEKNEEDEEHLEQMKLI